MEGLLSFQQNIEDFASHLIYNCDARAHFCQMAPYIASIMCFLKGYRSQKSQFMIQVRAIQMVPTICLSFPF